MNWSLWGSSAWDFPADLPGFTQAALRRIQPEGFAVRARLHAGAQAAVNSDVLDPQVFRRAGLNVEFEERHVLPSLEQPGKIRIGAVLECRRTGNYNRELVIANAARPARHQQRCRPAPGKPTRSTGGYINLEQALTPGLGLFARASLNDGSNENISFTDIDRASPAACRSRAGLGPAGRHGRHRRAR